MKHSLLVGPVFIVTWKILMNVPGPCQKGQTGDPYTGLCAQPASEVQSKYFDDYQDIKQWRAAVPKDAQYKIVDLTIYKESPEFLAKSDPGMK